MATKGMNRDAAARAIDDFLRALGRDPAVEPVLEGTGRRVADAWADEILEGYRVDVGAFLRAESAPIGPGTAASLVVLRDSETSLMCPHHLMPAHGLATVAYVPGARLVGIGALARLVDAYARRLLLQEDVGASVVRELGEAIGAEGALCHLRLRHACLSCRGERKRAWVETTHAVGALGPGGSFAPFAASLLSSASAAP
ncbi:MAG: GTP cyclohydrolase I [Polyangiaceae bacterium]|jgi:GTP cyclohydrolase I|nr:GTP cyclohydrolase I [Polyangiaceae bacterium]